MVYKLTVLDAALSELEDAVKWYGKISVELSDDLVSKFIGALDIVKANPLQSPEIIEGYRKLNLDRFPYKLVYKILEDEILVVAISHHKRNPNYWRKR
jgi:toxin ParE1/3/4